MALGALATCCGKQIHRLVRRDHYLLAAGCAHALLLCSTAASRPCLRCYCHPPTHSGQLGHSGGLVMLSPPGLVTMVQLLLLLQSNP
jgi:hypothetical protein